MGAVGSGVAPGVGGPDGASGPAGLIMAATLSPGRGVVAGREAVGRRDRTPSRPRFLRRYQPDQVLGCSLNPVGAPCTRSGIPPATAPKIGEGTWPGHDAYTNMGCPYSLIWVIWVMKTTIEIHDEFAPPGQAARTAHGPSPEGRGRTGIRLVLAASESSDPYRLPDLSVGDPTDEDPWRRTPGRISRRSSTSNPGTRSRDRGRHESAGLRAPPGIPRA